MEEYAWVRGEKSGRIFALRRQVAVPQTAGQFMGGQVAKLTVQLLGGHMPMKTV